MRIENLKAGHLIPAYTGFSRYDPEWCWVVKDGDSMVAALIASPAHDTVILLELLKFGEVKGNWIAPLLRHVAKECVGRGFFRTMTWLSDSRPEEKKLRRVMKVFCRGGREEAFSGFVLEGAIRA